MAISFYQQDLIAAVWSRATIDARSDADLAEHEYVLKLGQSYGNGSVKCIALNLDIDPQLWILMTHHENWKYCQLEARILPPLAAALGAGGTCENGTAATMVSPFELAGFLGGTLSQGGAYSPLNRLPFSFCMSAATSFVERFASARGVERLLLVPSAWCGFFFDVAWDLTALGISARDGTIYALCATDTD